MDIGKSRMKNASATWEDAVRWLIDQPDKVELTRAAYLDPPVSAAARRYHKSAEWAATRALLPSAPGRVIDLGAGNGIVSYALAADGWTVTAVEPDPSRLVGAGAIRELAADTGVRIDVIEAFGEAIPLESANYDVVIARQVLHHAADLPGFCREMARLVRAGGTVVTLRDHVIDGPESLAAFLKIHPLHHLYGGENAFTADQYRTALQGAGFAIDQQIGSFDSVINYAPMTEAEVIEAIASRIVPVRGIQAMVRIGLRIVGFPLVGRLATRVDRRPGRLVSFKARKV